MSQQYSSLDDSLREQLATVATANGYSYPCTVTLEDGSEQDRVFLASSSKWIKHWGIWPEDDNGKLSLDVSSIVSIRDSQTRLPVEFAAELYDAGESGMGYCIFTVLFADGSTQAYSSGNAVDFIAYPTGQSPSTVIGVLPHKGRNDSSGRNAPEYTWCLFD